MFQPCCHAGRHSLPGRESAGSCRAPAMQNPVHLRGKRRTITSPRGGIVMTSLVISPGCLSTQSWWGCHVQLGALWLGALRLRELVGLPRSAGCLASCARSGVLCPLWGLVPALGSCAPQGLLFRISRETDMRCHLLGTLAAGRSGRGRSGLGALWPPGTLASGLWALWPPGALASGRSGLALWPFRNQS